MNNDDLKRVAFMLELMSKRIDAIDQRVNEMSKRIDEIASPSSYDDDEAWCFHGTQPTKPINPNAENYTLELRSGPYTIYRDDDEPDSEWQRRKDHLMDQRVMFLNGSGQIGTPEQVAHFEEIMAKIAKARSTENLSENHLTPLETTATLRSQQ